VGADKDSRSMKLFIQR